MKWRCPDCHLDYPNCGRKYPEVHKAKGDCSRPFYDDIQKGGSG